MTEANTTPALSAEEIKAAKLAKIDTQIANLQAKRQAIVEGRDHKVAKAVYVPAVGDKVLATIGRNTATSQAKVVEAIVLGVRVPAEGEKGATQVRVQTGEGFDAQVFTLYPAQLEAVRPEGEDDGISDAPLGTLNV